MKSIKNFFKFKTSNNSEIYKNSVKLNCARNALRYTIQSFDIKEIYIPYYTCPFIWDILKKENCKMHFYHINKDFLPIQKFPKSAFILYTNYWGICDKNIKKLSKQYKNIIIDNALAFYMKKYGIASFNSARKFFNVPDGSYLLTNKILKKDFPVSISSKKSIQLPNSLYTQNSYQDYCDNEDRFEKAPIEYMSEVTQNLLQNINYKKVKKIRIQNFKFLHKQLKKINGISFHLTKNDIPMNYPLFIKDDNLRKKLKQNHIYIEQYWGRLSSSSIEGEFQKYLFLLPIDQRYTIKDMQYIIDVITK